MEPPRPCNAKRKDAAGLGCLGVGNIDKTDATSRLLELTSIMPSSDAAMISEEVEWASGALSSTGKPAIRLKAGAASTEMAVVDSKAIVRAATAP